MGGGGNWEFQMYVNNRTNSFTKDGVLYIQPTLTSDALGEETVRSGMIDMWGSSPPDMCTGNAFYGCMRNAAASGNVNNPIMSARLRSHKAFGFKYGRFQVRAKMPKGDWIWPAIWLLPRHNYYGNWPASGEIDIVESRGNGPECQAGGVDTFGSTLHWGPGWPQDAWSKAHAEFKSKSGNLNDDFHIYELQWGTDGLKTLIDGTEVLHVPFDEDMFTKGGFDKNQHNPWENEKDKHAPFNQEFYIILNVAVGGTGGYFPEG
jgi:beta-glucanase (GH16 family)